MAKLVRGYSYKRRPCTIAFGDNNEEEVEYLVTGRGISGIEPDKVLLIIEEVTEEE